MDPTDPQLRYTALSYCWGDSPTLKTTKENKDEHERVGILIHDMPATFQDAIKITRELGIRYLWIDALFIVQESKEYWESESISMCDIFAHSQITIGATTSSSSSSSFLRRSVNKPLTFQFRSSLSNDVAGEYPISLEARGPTRGYSDICQSRWHSRAWVWQERIMSTRQLLFGEKMVQFRCDEGVQMEDGYEHWWFDAVEDYSSKVLSYPKDRPGGLAGAAKSIPDYMKETGGTTEYLAGLWPNKSLERQLRWEYVEPKLPYSAMLESLQDKEGFIASSWSWASRNTGVRFPINGFGSLFQVIEYDLHPLETSTMIAVKFGSSITLRGKCRQTPDEPISGCFKQKYVHPFGIGESRLCKK